MDYKQKYLKYKIKYLHLKSLAGSGEEDSKIDDKQIQQYKDYYAKTILNFLKGETSNAEKIRSSVENYRREYMNTKNKKLYATHLEGYVQLLEF